MNKITIENSLTPANFIIVDFRRPVNGQTRYYFGSLAAVFAKFTPETLGVKLYEVYRDIKARHGRFVTDTCVISKARLYRLTRKKNNTPA